MAAQLSGSKLRTRRMEMGLRQGDVAQAAGVSASYLNLIEHNRRRVTPEVLARLAQVLGQPAASFADGGGSAVQDDLRAVASAWPSAEMDRVDDLAQRFPGWADTVLAMHQRNLALDGAIAAVNDRMSHDPHLSANLHEVLSAIASVRATAEILAEAGDLDPEWQARFLRNLDQDTARLATGAGALVRYLDTGGQIEAEGTATPLEEVEAWAAGLDWQIGGKDIVQSIAMAAMSAGARGMARALADEVRADMAALPDPAFAQAVAKHGPDPLAIANAFGAQPFSAFRRLAFQSGAGIGLVACDASGTLVLRRGAAGFSLPRFGAACPLWPLFSALARPMQPVESVVEIGAAGPLAPRFLLRAFGAVQHPAGFGAPELRRAMMLIIPLPAANTTPAAFGVGSTCRICSRAGCYARREPSIVAAGNQSSAITGL